MRPSSDITADEYFYGSLGVNHSDDQKPLTIQIRVFGTQVDYVRALPIHESQREIETNDDWSVFEYQIVPCFNFYQQLLWHREKIEVLSPTSVREEMENILISTLNHYKKA